MSSEVTSDVTSEMLTLGADLETQALHHVVFLSRVAAVPALKLLPVLRRALFRYERYWLPLAAEHNNGEDCLSAPLDIEWLWHCHMLSPISYGEDCMTVVGTIVNHTLPSHRDHDAALAKSKLHWHKKYGEHDVPFEVDYQTPLYPPVPADFVSKIAYDIIDAAGRQKVFYYQVSLPHYTDKKFLKGSLRRYKQFLFLKTQHPSTFIVPSFDMDLMWHTHQVNPLVYRTDTTNLLGTVFNHDDSTNDRTEGSKQYEGEQETIRLWYDLYKEPYAAAGTMFRGPPPDGILYKLSQSEINDISTKTATVTLKAIKILMSGNATIEKYKDIQVQCYGCSGNRQVSKWFSFKSKKTAKNENEISFDIKGDSFTLNTRTMNNVTLTLESNKRTLPFFGKSNAASMGELEFDFLSKLEFPLDKNCGPYQSIQRLDDECSVSIQCEFEEPVCGSALLFLKTGTTEESVIPTNVQALLGPVNFERLHSHADNRCQITTIGLKNHVGKEDLTCKVVFSKALSLHVIQVFYRGHMVSLAHFIGCDQLPSTSQVEKDVVTLDHHHQGERAILIKNHVGDWAVLKGKWVAGLPRASGIATNNNRTAQGTLALYLYKMTTRMCERTCLDPAKGSFRLDGTNVDLLKGVVEVDNSASRELGERVAMAFSVSLLQKLLVPKK